MTLKVIQNDVKKVVAIAAGKGGVGKSTLTVLLASALKRLGEKVGVLDVDLYGPSIRQMLPEEKIPEQQEGKWLPAVAQGIKMLSYSFFSKEPFVRAPLANQILRQLLQNVFWGQLDWLLMDFPPGTGDIPLTATQLVSFSGAVLVTTPQKVAALDVQKTIALFRKVNVPILGIIENMSYYQKTSCAPFGIGAGMRLSEENGIPFLGKIPIEATISEYGDAGKLCEIDLPQLTAIAELLKQKSDISSLPIQSVAIVDQKDLKIVWENGTLSYLEAHKLQAHCPCAQCKLSKNFTREVKISGFERVGSYGLKFSFSSGCSFGIYPFDLLKELVHAV